MIPMLFRLISENEFTHEIKHDGITSLQGIHESHFKTVRYKSDFAKSAVTIIITSKRQEITCGSHTNKTSEARLSNLESSLKVTNAFTTMENKKKNL